MAKVFGVREIALRGGADAAAFERYLREEYYPLWARWAPEMVVYVLQGDRGDRAGRYLHLLEFASVEARARILPPPAGDSVEFGPWQQAHAGVLEAGWNAFVAAPLLAVIWTDYVAVGQ